MERHFTPRWSFLWIALIACVLGTVHGFGEEIEVTSLPPLPAAEVEGPAEPAPDAKADVKDDVKAEAKEAPAKDLKEPKNFSEMVNTCWDLLKRGGLLMWPIGVISILVLTVGLERLFALCGCFCMPKRLFEELNTLIVNDSTPLSLYRLAKAFPCAGSNVIQALLYKTGRPMLEVQAEYEDAKNNEANRLFRPVRLLVLAASVTPLIGLLGTVIGMIQAFIEVSNISEATAVGANRADLLAQGIYVALVTTCAGLIVAIPAAILAHWYEGRISRLFQKLDRNLLNFFSWMESKEGKMRVTPAQLNGEPAAGARSTSHH